MHAWEAIQKTLNDIEERIKEDITIEELAEIATLSLFYYQRLFTRLVKKPVREYMKLRRLARACDTLRDKQNRILDVALEYGFDSHESFTRAFKEAYGITPSEYRDHPIILNHFDKPNLLLSYVMVDEGVPLISDGMILEYHRKYLDEPINFLGVKDYWHFKRGKMLGERTEVSEPAAIFQRFWDVSKEIPSMPGGRIVGVSYHGDAKEGYSTYFVGVEVKPDAENSRFASWQLPAREYIVCEFEAENVKQLWESQGKMMKYTRFWLKKHGLIADGFFPEIYYTNSSEMAYMEMWIPFKKRENNIRGGIVNE